MTLAVQDSPAQLSIQQESGAMEYVPFGAEDKIKLTTSIIRNLIATPTKEGDLPDSRECFRFMMLCRAGRLNPFAGDAYLIGFFDKYAGVVKWSLITSIHAFYKRAENHPEYDGIESGVIVRDRSGELVDRVGDFVLDDDVLAGGWATVHFKNRQHPMRKRMKLSTYKKEFGVWKNDPAGMICKVAEAHALRDSFPTLMGGLYLREELEASNGEPAKKEGIVPSPSRPFGPQSPEVIPHPTDENKVIDISDASEEAPQEETPTLRREDETTVDLASYESFKVAMAALAVAKNIDSKQFDALMLKLPAGVNNKTSERRRVYEAAAHGAMNWTTGAIG